MNDDFPGEYPPDDTGSTGYFAMKAAAVDLRLVKDFSVTQDPHVALEGLMEVPITIGIDWYEGFDEPDSSGLVLPRGRIRGGHEVFCAGYDASEQLIWLRNSWGPDYGVLRYQKPGFFCMKYRDFASLLRSGGDACIPEKP